MISAIGTWGSGLTAVEQALTGVDGPVAVVGDARLARALGDRRADIVAVGVTEREQRKLERSAVTRVDAGLESGDASGGFGAVVGRGSSAEELAAWTAAVRDGGTVIAVDRGRREDLARRGLCAGLMEIEQRQSGRTVVTSGKVAKLP